MALSALVSDSLMALGTHALGSASTAAVLPIESPPQVRQPARISESERTAQADKALVARIQLGDELAAEGLIERLYPTIIKMVRCHLPRRDHEEDLVQAVFLKIFRKLHQYSGLAPLEHWVSRITINTCNNRLRHEIGRPELRMADLSEEEEAVVHCLAFEESSPSDARHAARELLGKLLAFLKPDERMVVTLLHLEERSSEEISRLTGWSVSRVKVKAFRARHKLRRLWKIHFQEEKP